MNTIKVYLNESGSIATLNKDFPLYQYQYENKLLNVYVPTSITQPNFIEITNNVVTGAYTAGTALKTRISYTNTNGKVYESDSYYLRYLKTLTQNGVEYALFERKLPKEYTYYSGAGVNAPIMTFNVVVVNATSVDNVQEGTILSITSSQTCPIDVMPSTSQDIDVALQASEVEELESSINALTSALLGKQDKTDSSIINQIDPDDKTVVGSINSLMTQVKSNKDNISSLDGRVSQNTTDIGTLRDLIGTGEFIVGQMTTTALPTTQQLDLFVVNNTTDHRQSRNGDVIIVILQIAGATDTIYKYFKANFVWQHYEIQYLEKAGNTEYGIIKGNYIENDITPKKIRFNIVNGEIISILFNDDYGELDIPVENILNYVMELSYGYEVVPKALKDGNNNVIADTYMTKSLGATKTMVQDYALPRVFNDILYFKLDDKTVVNSKDNLPDDNTSKTINIDNIGSFEIDTFTYTIPKVENVNIDFSLSAKNSCKIGLSNVFSNILTEPIYLRAEIYYQTQTETEGVYNAEVLLGAEVTAINPFANVNVLNDISVVFDNLNNAQNKSVKLKSGDRIIAKLSFESESSENIIINVMFNKTYSSSINLNVGTVVKTVLKGDIDAIDLNTGIRTLTYDTTDGITMQTCGKVNYDNGENNDITVEQELPIIADTGITMDADETNTHIKVKVDTNVIATHEYVLENGGKVETITLGSQVLQPTNKNITIPTQQTSTLDIEEVDTIDIDDTPTANSQNLIKSGGVYDFVNSSITTNTAYFKGTFASVDDLPTTDVTNNDYAFVTSIDSAGNTIYTRYKYVSSTTSWIMEYQLNNSGFTAEQWETINSGLTSSDKDDIAQNMADIADIQTNYATKNYVDTAISNAITTVLNTPV